MDILIDLNCFGSYLLPTENISEAAKAANPSAVGNIAVFIYIPEALATTGRSHSCISNAGENNI